MARKFGSKNEVKIDPLAYNIALIGEAGVGKTSVIYETCQKLVGDDGYIFLEMGREDGADAIQGIVCEPVEDYAKFEEVTDDIIENRFTDYKDLRVVVIDTYDELMTMAEQKVIQLWNRENPDKRTTSFKATYGGFNGPTDKAIEIVLNRLWELKRVGVSFIVIGHTKKSEIVDPVSGESYSMLTTNLDKRYFNALKTKVHFLGVAYIDREIARVKTGRKNVVTGKEEVVGKVNAESRVICFRDDNFSVDSKSRFADIVDRIPLNSDELIKALTDAIKKEQAKSGVAFEDAAVKQQAEAKAAEVEQVARIEKHMAAKQAADDEANRDQYVAHISDRFMGAPKATQTQAKEMLIGAGFRKFSDPDLPIETLKAIAALL